MKLKVGARGEIRIRVTSYLSFKSQFFPVFSFEELLLSMWWWLVRLRWYRVADCWCAFWLSHWLPVVLEEHWSRCGLSDCSHTVKRLSFSLEVWCGVYVRVSSGTPGFAAGWRGRTEVFCFRWQGGGGYILPVRQYKLVNHEKREPSNLKLWTLNFVNDEDVLFSC